MGSVLLRYRSPLVADFVAEVADCNGEVTSSIC
jgi:hypothetical protein